MKKVFIYIFVLLVMVGLVGGFAWRLFSQNAKPAPKATPSEGVSIKWSMRWDSTRVENIAVPVVEAFQKLHPDIKVEFENLTTSSSDYQKLIEKAMAANTVPDVIYPATHYAYAWASRGALLPLGKYIQTDEVDLSKYDKPMLDLYLMNNEPYCLPTDTGALVVFYNKAIFDKAGVPYPKAGWTWDDFLATAKALTADLDKDGQTDQFGVDRFVNFWSILVWTKTGHAVFDDLRKPTQFLIKDPESIQAIQWMADLINVHHVMPTDAQSNNVGDMFLAKKAAMAVTSHGNVAVYLAKARFAFDFAPLPKGKIEANRADGSCFAISATSKHPKEAWELIKFLAGPNALGERLQLNSQQKTPVLLDSQQDDVFLKPEQLPKANISAFLAGKDHLFSMYDPIHPMYAAWDTLWKKELQEVWRGNTTAAKAVERMTPEVEKMLANLASYK